MVEIDYGVQVGLQYIFVFTSKDENATAKKKKVKEVKSRLPVAVQVNVLLEVILQQLHFL